MKIVRSKTVAVVPAVLATLVLTACQDAAPTAAPPSAPASSAAPQSAAPTTAAPTAEPSESTSSSPSEETTPEASSSGSSGECQSTDLFKLERGDVSPKPLSEPQTIKKEQGEGEAQVSFGKPTVDTSGGTSFFPGDGFQVAIYPVTVKAVTGSYVISELHFGLTDPSDRPCKRDVGNAVVPSSDEIPVEILKQGDAISGKVGFAIPAGADLSKYSLVYSQNYSEGKAELAWRAK